MHTRLSQYVEYVNKTLLTCARAGIDTSYITFDFTDDYINRTIWIVEKPNEDGAIDKSPKTVILFGRKCIITNDLFNAIKTAYGTDGKNTIDLTRMNSLYR